MRVEIMGALSSNSPTGMFTIHSRNAKDMLEEKYVPIVVAWLVCCPNFGIKWIIYALCLQNSRVIDEK